MMGSLRQGALAVAVVSLCAACSSSSTVSVSAGQAAISSAPRAKDAPRNLRVDPFADPATPRQIVYDPGLVSDPLPSPVPSTSISADDAIGVADKDSFGSDLRLGEPTATLRMVKVGFPDDTPVAQSQPSWILTWTDSEPDVHGPSAQSQSAAKVKCVFVYVVDANSGASLDARQLCKPDPS